MRGFGDCKFLVVSLMSLGHYCRLCLWDLLFVDIAGDVLDRLFGEIFEEECFSGGVECGLFR
jgi:hypothetical protein